MFKSVAGFFKDLFFGKRKHDQRGSTTDDRISGPPSKRSRLGFSMDKEDEFSPASTSRQDPSPVRKLEMRETVVTLTSTPANASANKHFGDITTSPIVYDISDDEDDEPVARLPPATKPKVPVVIDLESPNYREPMSCPRTSPWKNRSSSFGRYSRIEPQKNGLRRVLYQFPSPSTAWPFQKQPASTTFSAERALEIAKVDLDELFPSPSSAVPGKTIITGKASGASTSVTVSVTETGNSESSSSSPSESQTSDLKPSASLERLDGVCSRSPLAELNEKFDTWDPMRLRSKLARDADAKARRKETIEKLNTEARLRRDARLALQKSVEDEIRTRMRLEGLLIEEKELPEEVEELIELTDEQLGLVRKAVGPGRDDEILVKAFSVDITRRDLKTLVGSNWLNDEVVNFYFQLLMDRGGKDGLPKVYSTNTFFYPKVMQGGQESVKRWTRKIDIFSYDMMLVPVHLGNHWCLAVVDFRKEIIQYYDSLGGYNEECLQALAQYLEDEHMEKKKSPFDTSGWELMTMTDIPHQKNGSDCGVFACRFAEYVSRDAPISFTQENMPYFRVRTIYEILTKRLL